MKNIREIDQLLATAEKELSRLDDRRAIILEQIQGLRRERELITQYQYTELSSSDKIHEQIMARSNIKIIYLQRDKIVYRLLLHAVFPHTKYFPLTQKGLRELPVLCVSWKDFKKRLG